ncbi:MAG: hypothetical protein AAGH79_19485 [Bacteroidota bacterium]
MNKRILLIATIIMVSILVLPLLFYGLEDFIRSRKRVHIKDQFYIEYLEMYNAISLRNGNQGLLGGINEAYWDEEILVVKSSDSQYEYKIALEVENAYLMGYEEATKG